MDHTNSAETIPLSTGEQVILSRLTKGPIHLRWGRNGWVPEGLPKAAKRKDFDSICKRHDLVKIELAQLLAVTAAD